METTVTIIKNIFKRPILWGSVIPMQFLGLWAIYNIVTGSAPSWWWAATIMGYVCLAMLGIGAGYHRYLSHKGFEVSRPVKLFMLWCAAVSGQGSPVFWVTSHRGYHHRHTDKEGDPHSPTDGFFHSYILWVFKLKDNALSPRSIVDLMREPDVMFIHNHYQKILWISHALIALISVDLWLYTLAFPAFITLHSYSIQTSMSHSKVYGYKNYEQDNDAVNVWWLFPLILGETWHNNHHGDAKNPNFGGRHWWEFDPTYRLIQLIRTK
jgi:stearoyl-CoA desaturase (delta-9 desaturase)